VGGGRKRATDLDPTLVPDLDALVEPTAPGDPDSPLRWTCLSARTLAVALGDRVSHTVVAELLHTLGYRLQGNVKTREGRQHIDRDAQFRYIARRVRAAQQRQQPTISVDTKKKELVGAFTNGGRTWRPAKTPQRVCVHDFVVPATATTGGKAIPYGYDLQRLAHRTGLAITVCHFPPGTSKWNTIEHRLFSHIAMNWRGHAARRPGHHRQPHRLDAQREGSARPLRARPRRLSQRGHRHGCADGHPQPRAASLPR
jgi:hypothetical protein